MCHFRWGAVHNMFEVSGTRNFSIFEYLYAVLDVDCIGSFYVLCGYQMIFFDASGVSSIGVEVRFLSLLILFGIIISEW